MPLAQDYLEEMATFAKQQTPLLTDLQAGSIFRSLLEGLAVQLERANFAAISASEQAIRESAYRVFGFERRQAQNAYGTLRITTTSPNASIITVPAATQVRVAGTDRVYRLNASVSIPAGVAGRTFSVAIIAINVGTKYNTPALTINEFISPIASLSITNPAPITTGRDEETDDERRQRFATFVRSMNPGTAESIEYAAETVTITDNNGLIIERVTHARVRDVSKGYCHCYITNGNGTIPSNDLLAAVQEATLPYKAAGATLDIIAAPLVAVTININVKLAPSTNLVLMQTPIADAIESVFNRLAIGDIFYIQQLEQAVLNLPGVIDIETVSPVANVDPTESGLIVINGSATIGEIA